MRKHFQHEECKNTSCNISNFSPSISKFEIATLACYQGFWASGRRRVKPILAMPRLCKINFSKEQTCTRFNLVFSSSSPSKSLSEDVRPQTSSCKMHEDAVRGVSQKYWQYQQHHQFRQNSSTFPLEVLIIQTQHYINCWQEDDNRYQLVPPSVWSISSVSFIVIKNILFIAFLTAQIIVSPGSRNAVIISII